MRSERLRLCCLLVVVTAMVAIGAGLRSGSAAADERGPSKLAVATRQSKDQPVRGGRDSLVPFLCLHLEERGMRCTGWLPARGKPNRLDACPWARRRIDDVGRRHSCRFGSGAPRSFTVGGGAVALLYPGTSAAIDLVFDNRTGSTIRVPTGGVTIGISTTRPGCSASNFAIVKGLGKALRVPAHAKVSLSSPRGIGRHFWPVITMRETRTNQDACEGVTVHLSYQVTGG